MDSDFPSIWQTYYNFCRERKMVQVLTEMGYWNSVFAIRLVTGLICQIQLIKQVFRQTGIVEFLGIGEVECKLIANGEGRF